MRHGRWWIVELEGLREPKSIQQKYQKVVCLGGSRRKSLDLGLPCERSESWLREKNESHQYIYRGCSQ